MAFDLREKHLEKHFNKFGKIISCNVPVKNENNLNRGFGFVEFETKEEATEAVKEMNSSSYKGRTLAVEFSVSKNTYEQRLGKIVDNTNMTKEEA